MMIVTTISILAVDFPCYPRRFGKTETYGVSLMDVGVGSFLFSNAVVYGAVEARKHALLKPQSPGPVPSRPSLPRTLLSVAPLLLLGAARTLAVKASDYQEHVSEYGTHWSFFLTLGVVLFTSRLFPLSPRAWLPAGVGVALAYEVALSGFGLGPWVVSQAPRDSFFAANREGIVSCAGYYALFLVGARVGAWMRSLQAPAPGQNKAPKAGAAFWLLGASLVLYVFTAGLEWLGLPASRRLANLNYVVFVTAYNLQQLGCFALLEQAGRESVLAAAINRSALFVFLFANLLTGSVNLTISTLDVADVPAVGILSAYGFLVYYIVYRLHLANVTLKFW